MKNIDISKADEGKADSVEIFSHQAGAVTAFLQPGGETGRIIEAVYTTQRAAVGEYLVIMGIHPFEQGGPGRATPGGRDECIAELCALVDKLGFQIRHQVLFHHTVKGMSIEIIEQQDDNIGPRGSCLRDDL